LLFLLLHGWTTLCRGGLWPTGSEGMQHLSRQNDFFCLSLFMASGKALQISEGFLMAARLCAEGFKVSSSGNLVFPLCSLLCIKTAPCDPQLDSWGLCPQQWPKRYYFLSF
jgi:hypothetical protein